MKKDHLEILLEDILGKFDLVLEGHAALDRKIDVRFDELNEKIEHNSYMIGVLNKKIDSVEESLGNRIDRVEESLNTRIDRVEESLNTRIDRVEENLGNRLDALSADLAAHRADTEVHHGIYRVKEV
jgi:chaperonin cofactor prefoldin